jgi:nucleotide-binding universal stress UspA family protein
MTYKTIVVHVDQSRHAAARIRLAAELAISEGAHLVGAAMTGISSIPTARCLSIP